MRFDIVKNNRRSPCRLLSCTDSFILIIQRCLAGYITLKLARQVDAGFRRQAIKRRRLIKLIIRILIQPRANRIEEIVTGMRNTLDNRLIGVLAQSLRIQPAARRIRFVIFVKPAAVADPFGQRKLTIQQTGSSRNHLENRTRRIARTDSVVDQRVA